MPELWDDSSQTDFDRIALSTAISEVRSIRARLNGALHLANTVGIKGTHPNQVAEEIAHYDRQLAVLCPLLRDLDGPLDTPEPFNESEGEVSRLEVRRR